MQDCVTSRRSLFSDATSTATPLQLALANELRQDVSKRGLLLFGRLLYCMQGLASTVDRSATAERATP